MLAFLAAPFVASLILTGIHAYLGVHVVERGGIILAVSWPEVAKTALLYSAIGAFHYIFRKKFLAISMDHKRAEDQGLNVKFWDFLFYASFGFVVTSSVAIAGVLLVFCYLIVPSVAAMLYADSIGQRLAIGWSMGTLVSGLGVYLPLSLALPTGATIVCSFGLVMIITALVRPLVQRSVGSDIHQVDYADHAHRSTR